MAGWQGGERFHAGNFEWDAKWYRIEGMLAFVGLYVEMTEDEWEEKHFSKDLISVLVFAGRFPSIGHARARFLTLRRVDSQSDEPRWERIGTVQLTWPDVALTDCMTSAEFLQKIHHSHLREGNEGIVIQ